MNQSVTKALSVIDGAQKNGALTFVSREDCMAVTPLYKPEVTIIQLRLPKAKNDPDADVYDIQGKYMPKREIVDRIGEATGLMFIREGCRTWTETLDDNIAGKRTVYISEQQGKKRMGDGSWRTSSVQAYEFDPTMRAMLDYGVTELNAQTKQTKDKWGKKTLAQTILEYTKVARQRAETGARLRVIRELTSMPTAFSPAEASKPLVFGRFAQNTDYILQTPEGRSMANAQALGIDVASIFGGRRLPPADAGLSAPAVLSEAAVQAEDIPAQAEYSEYTAPADSSASEAQAAAATLAEQAAADTDEFEKLTASLAQWCETYKETLDVVCKNGANPYKLAQEELDPNNFNASVKTRNAMIERVKNFLIGKGVKI